MEKAKPTTVDSAKRASSSTTSTRLQQPTDVLQNEQKQVTLLEAKTPSSNKKLIYYGQQYWYRGQYGEVQKNQKVGVYLDLENSKKNGLGMPLPKGIGARLQGRQERAPSSSSARTTIDHTPRDEKVRVKMGDAFDVVGDRKQMSWKPLGSCMSESSWEIELRNHKDTAVEVEDVEPDRWRLAGPRREPHPRQEGRLHLHLHGESTRQRQDQDQVPSSRALVLADGKPRLRGITGRGSFRLPLNPPGPARVRSRFRPSWPHGPEALPWRGSGFGPFFCVWRRSLPGPSGRVALRPMPTPPTPCASRGRRRPTSGIEWDASKRSEKVTLDTVDPKKSLQLYKGKKVRADVAARDGSLLVAMIRGGSDPFVRFSLVDLSGSEPKLVSVKVARPADAERRPASVVATADPQGFSVIWQEESTKDPSADVKSYFTRVTPAGKLSTKPTLVAIPWALAALAHDGKGYHLALFYDGAQRGETRLAMVTLSADGAPQQHPWWASAPGDINDVELVRIGARVLAYYRAGASAAELFASDVTAEGQWGQEPSPAQSQGKIAPDEVYAVTSDKAGKARLERRKDEAFR